MSESKKTDELNRAAENSANGEPKAIGDVAARLKLGVKNELSILDDVLTPEEKETILKRAANQKRGELSRKAYWDAINAPDKPIEFWDWREYVEDLQEAAGDGFVVDDDNREVIETLAKYFTNSPEFEKIKEGYSLKKGLILHGPIGVGKSKLMKMFLHNQRQAFRIVDCVDIGRAYAKKGEDSLVQYFKDQPVMVRNDFNHMSAGYCFDDLGVENDARFFGTECKVMESILEFRYRSKDTLVTHLITNLNAKEITTRYGVRIADRMKEMFNLVSYPVAAQSRRR